MNRIKAVYRSWSIRCGGRDVYYKRNREIWLAKFPIRESQIRAARYYDQLDLLREQRKDSKKLFLKEARRYPVQRILRGIPGFDAIAVLVRKEFLSSDIILSFIASDIDPIHDPIERFISGFDTLIGKGFRSLVQMASDFADENKMIATNEGNGSKED
jgi:hypothetical protein